MDHHCRTVCVEDVGEDLVARSHEIELGSSGAVSPDNEVGQVPQMLAGRVLAAVLATRRVQVSASAGEARCFALAGRM